MRGAIISPRNSQAVSMGIVVGRQAALSTLNILMDELCRAQAERYAGMAELKAEFDREIATLQRELNAARAELEALRWLDGLNRWQPTSATRN